MKFLIVFISILFFFNNPIYSQVLKVGSCPSGWNTSGNYCIASYNAQPIVHKNGSNGENGGAE